MRFVVAGELAGARGNLGGIGAQWGNLAQIAVAGLVRNQERAARVPEAQNLGWRRLARDRRGITKEAHQLPGPYQPRVMRVITGRRKDSDARIGDPGERKKRGMAPQKRRDKGGSSRGRRKRRPPAEARSPEETGHHSCPRRRYRGPYMKKKKSCERTEAKGEGWVAAAFGRSRGCAQCIVVIFSKKGTPRNNLYSLV